MEATTAPATKCHTCGKAFDPETDDNCDIVEIETGEDEVAEAPRCGECAPAYVPPTGHYEVFRLPGQVNRSLVWVED
jgi:hypothetical protein